MLLSHSSMFLPADLKRRVFHTVSRPVAANGSMIGDLPLAPPRGNLIGLDQLRNAALLASPVAQIVVTSDGLVALSNRQANNLFGLSTRDIGRPFRDLDLSYRPVELRKYIEQAQVERRTLHVTDVEYIRGLDETGAPRRPGQPARRRRREPARGHPDLPPRHGCQASTCSTSTSACPWTGPGRWCARR